MSPTLPIILAHRAPAAAKVPRDQRDSAAGCRERAAADLLAGAAFASLNEQRRMELSSAVWIKRAELLDRMEASAEARRTVGPNAADGEELAAARS
jgi:hypothetical protein